MLFVSLSASAFVAKGGPEQSHGKPVLVHDDGGELVVGVAKATLWVEGCVVVSLRDGWRGGEGGSGS